MAVVNPGTAFNTIDFNFLLSGDLTLRSKTVDNPNQLVYQSSIWRDTLAIAGDHVVGWTEANVPQGDTEYKTFFQITAFSVPLSDFVELYETNQPDALLGLVLAGDDIINGLDQTVGDALFGYGGNDAIFGEPDNLTFWIDNFGPDTLVGGDGNDTLFGGPGPDILDGGAGFDIATYDHSPALDGVIVDLENPSSNEGILAEGDSMVSIEGVIGTFYSDTLSGNAANNYIWGSFGFNDLLSGRGGNDTLEGSNNAAPDFSLFDTLDGGAGEDTATFANHNRGVSGSIATGLVSGVTLISIESLEGSPFADNLEGDAGDNSLVGLGGDDTLIGLAGHDTLRGEAGADQLFTGFGRDRADGGEGNDFIRTGPDNDTLIGDIGDDTLGASNRTDLLRGGDGNDLLLGSNGNDRLFGDAGSDTLLGGNGRDTIEGGDGNDRVIGGGGNDRMRGGVGDDTFIGGAGNERYAFFDGEAGDDVILDFFAGAGSEDVIVLIGFGAAFDDFADIQAAATQSGADTVIDFGGGNSLILAGINVGDLHPDDFIFG